MCVVLCVYVSGRAYLCNSGYCLAAAHNRFAVVTYGCLPEDMYFAPSSHGRAAAVSPDPAPRTLSSPKDYEQKHPAVAFNVTTEPPHQPTTIDIDLSCTSSDDGDMDMDMDMPELELEEGQDTDSSHHLPVAQDQNGIGSTMQAVAGAASRSTSVSGLRTTAEAGVQSNHNMVFKVRIAYACARPNNCIAVFTIP